MYLLLVDTDPGNRGLLDQVAGAAGHILYRPDTLEEAERICEHEPVEVVLVSRSVLPDGEPWLSLLKKCRSRARSVVPIYPRAADAAAATTLERQLIEDFLVEPLDPAVVSARLALIERRRAERARERALLAAMPDMMFRLRRDGTYIDYHARQERHLYRPPEEFLGRRIHDVWPEAADESMRVIEQTLSTGQIQTMEYEMEMARGRRCFEARVVPSGPDEVLTIIRDVTAEKATLEELAKSRATRQAILEAIPDSVVRMSADGALLDYIPGHPVPIGNIGTHLIGKSRAELVATIPQLPEGLVDEATACIQRALASGEVQRLEYALGDASSERHYEMRMVSCGGDEVIGIARDITERRAAEEKLRSAAAVQRAFATNILNVLESERHHLSRELHDVVGQLLLVHRLDAEWLANRTSDPAARGAAEDLCGKLDETLQLVRALALGLRPPALDDLGLGSALETLVGDISRRSGIRCECVVDPEVTDLSSEVGVALYRIAQEALANAVRHSGCGHIELSLEPVDGAVELRVLDDGVGIEPRRLDGYRSLGLLGMRERAELLGGHVTIRRTAAGGTEIIAVIPPRPSLASGVPQ